MADKMMDYGKDPRNTATNRPPAGGSAPASTILGPKERWQPGPIPDRAAASEADEDLGGKISTAYNTEM